MTRVAAVLALAGACLMLSGCVAAVIPVVAGATIAKKKLDKDKATETEQPATGPRWTKTAGAPSAAPEPAVQMAAIAPPPVALLAPGAGAPAAPQGPAAGESYSAFISFALNEADRLGAGEAIQSQLLVKDFDIDNPKYQECTNGHAAVMLDLDNAGGGAGDTPAPGLADGLAQLRKAGVSILWLTDAATSDQLAIRARLKASGLDATGADRIYARSQPADRKQLFRLSAARDYCVVAMAGDVKTDLEEAYGYLRDPELGHAIDRKWNAGWFLLPPPLQTEPKKEEAHALDPR